ncbi:hypothetical protein [Phenylobacterium sp.]|uniref:hypothetical protein n=1 Tax=Phenylobacterium sp. TaxID=1871053 RepID=UPI002DEA28B2|nr:hypothetical protein [Phenylobacterium sp.]
MSAAYPRAVSHFGLAAMQGRAARTREVTTGEALSPETPRPPGVRRRRTVVRLWLPLTPLFLLLAPFALVLALVGYFVPPRLRPDPLIAAVSIGALLLALGGTEILVDTPDAYVRLKIL